jgi:hypothetical protein
MSRTITNENDMTKNLLAAHVATASASEGSAFELKQTIVADLVCVCVCFCGAFAPAAATVS